MLRVPGPGPLRAPEKDFAEWKKLLDGGDEALNSMINSGEDIVGYQDMLIKSAVRSASLRRLKEAPEHTALVVNSSVLPSEIGSALAEKGLADGTASYAIVARYNPRHKSWGFSLRSKYGVEGAADVSLIAKKYGGGGHRAAAGMGGKDVSINIEDMFIDEQKE
jgi:nanoRNase/pAp phosphatase (c-di-AMP/oligoRNAs hydrolase)